MVSLVFEGIMNEKSKDATFLGFLHYSNRGGSAGMKKGTVVCIVLSGIFLAAALFSYFYVSRSTGLLPVITYPLRAYTIPFAIISATLASCGVFIQARKRK